MFLSRRAFLATTGLGSLGCSNRSHDAGFFNRIAELEARIPRLLRRLHVPGVSLAIIQDAEIAWSRAFGTRDTAFGAPVDGNTAFSAQSMSKPVFAYRVMKLCEQGVLDLDVPLTRYTSQALLDDPRMEGVTARRVLSHTTGLPNWRSKEDPLRFQFNPGEKWSYSGEGYSYLQSVVTRLTGRTDEANCKEFELGYRVCATDFGDAMATHILRPFGMERSGYVWTEAIGKNEARPHDKEGRAMPARRSTAVEVARYGSAGSLLTTATDYASFLIEVMDPKPADGFRLSQASRDEMLRPHVLVPEFPIPCSWALGWQIWQVENKGPLAAHGGDIDGFHSHSMLSVDRRSGFVILTNGEGGLDLIWNHLLTDLIDHFV